MDPTACLDELRAAVEAGDREAAVELFHSLDGWLSRGGFLPAQWDRQRSN
jgi:hypothetical protein